VFTVLTRYLVGVRSHVGVRRAMSFGKASTACKEFKDLFLINLEGSAGLELDPMTKIPRTAGAVFGSEMDTQEAEFQHHHHHHYLSNHLWNRPAHDSFFRNLPTSLSVTRDKKPTLGMGCCTASPSRASTAPA
jgi:hypothetical protein